MTDHFRSTAAAQQRALRTTAWLCCFFGIALAAGGCADPTSAPVVFYCEGAGWYSSAGAVHQGLRDAGYRGAFYNYAWGANLGPAPDHFLAARSKGVAQGLARKIEKVRRSDPEGQIDIMGLSAGTAVVLSAIEQLPRDVQVDNVVLFSPSVSAEHDLTKALRRVKRNLYATSSPHDAILSTLAVNADGKPGPPAGRTGFRMPVRRSHDTETAYRRVVNLPWQPGYLAFDWSGGHTGVTNRRLVASVIAPRVLTDEPFPLDRSIADRLALSRAGESP